MMVLPDDWPDSNPTDIRLKTMLLGVASRFCHTDYKIFSTLNPIATSDFYFVCLNSSFCDLTFDLASTTYDSIIPSVDSVPALAAKSRFMTLKNGCP